MPAAELLANGCNLDRKNPNAATISSTCRPNNSPTTFSRKSSASSEIMAEIKHALYQHSMVNTRTRVPLADILDLVSRAERVDPEKRTVSLVHIGTQMDST